MHAAPEYGKSGEISNRRKKRFSMLAEKGILSNINVPRPIPGG
jgi:hypothetical protein